MGSTAPSVTGSRNLLECQAVASGSGLRLAVADDAGDDEIRVVEHRAERMAQRVAELAALVDRARALGRGVAGDAARKRELLEQLAQAGLVLEMSG
jgi:hypothetical protein